MERPLIARSSTGESIVRLKKELKKFMKLDELTSEMVHRFIDKIEVQADGDVFRMRRRPNGRMLPI
ncbi:DUF4368 domain-containing protein [Paenibacillus sp. HWE-109]|uniref:DUF4368 domain-containing protein n=1 Tax=Paenibacillus sp. HWE-109 TaxID=1306526 RepID=UPI003FCD7C87